MTAPLTPEREQEIRARMAALNADRTLSFGTWTAGPVNKKSVFPPEMAFVVEDVALIGGASLRGSVGVFGDERHAEFTAAARQDVLVLLAEIDRLRGEVDDLEDDSAKLAALEAAGVDNWDGYEEALAGGAR